MNHLRHKKNKRNIKTKIVTQKQKGTAVKISNGIQKNSFARCRSGQKRMCERRRRRKNGKNTYASHTYRKLLIPLNVSSKRLASTPSSSQAKNYKIFSAAPTRPGRIQRKKKVYINTNARAPTRQSTWDKLPEHVTHDGRSMPAPSAKRTGTTLVLRITIVNATKTSTWKIFQLSPRCKEKAKEKLLMTLKFARHLKFVETIVAQARNSMRIWADTSKRTYGTQFYKTWTFEESWVLLTIVIVPSPLSSL